MFPLVSGTLSGGLLNMLKAPCKLVESFVRYLLNVRGMFKRASKYRLNVLSNNFLGKITFIMNNNS